MSDMILKKQDGLIDDEPADIEFPVPELFAFAKKTKALFPSQRLNAFLNSMPETIQFAFDRRAISICSLVFSDAIFRSFACKLGICEQDMCDVPERLSVVFPLCLRDTTIACDQIDNSTKLRSWSKIIYGHEGHFINCEGASIAGIDEATPFSMATYISERISRDSKAHNSTGSVGTILELCGGFAANSAAFACHGFKVHTVEISSQRIAIMRENLHLHAKLTNQEHVSDNIEIIHSDGCTYIENDKDFMVNLRGVFISPPWGGSAYKFQHWFSLVNESATLKLIKNGWDHILRSLNDNTGSAPPKLYLYLPRSVLIEELMVVAAILGNVASIECDRLMMRSPTNRKIHPIFSHRVSLVIFSPKVNDDQLDCVRSFLDDRVLLDAEVVGAMDLKSGPIVTSSTIRQQIQLRRDVVLAQNSNQIVEHEMDIWKDDEQNDAEPAPSQNFSLHSDCTKPKYFPSYNPHTAAKSIPAFSAGRKSAFYEFESLYKQYDAKVKNHKLRRLIKTAIVSASDLISENYDPLTFSIAVSICDFLNEDIVSHCDTFSYVYSLVGWHACLSLLQDTQKLYFENCYNKTEQGGDQAGNTLLTVDGARRAKGGIFFNLFKRRHREEYNLLEKCKKDAKKQVSELSTILHDNPVIEKRQLSRTPIECDEAAPPSKKLFRRFNSLNDMGYARSGQDAFGHGRQHNKKKN